MPDTIEAVTAKLHRIAEQRASISHDCRLFAVVSEDIDELLDAWLELHA